ncbi:UDP-glucose dehydrogenase family protein [Reyranella sp.]|uniref:UDP-glucose dehydrogenase family protein n=1 Tax=Reyranella sp. TaxID=1929291 RepID=UPI003D0F6BA3
MKLMIVGSGYVGLVTGACLSELGHEIVCVDRDAKKIEGLRSGILPIFEPGLDELVLRNAAAGRLTFASDLAELNRGVEAVLIAVGTPPSSIDQSADLSSVFAVVREVARTASDGLVIITKSTVPVGTGDKIADIMRTAAPALRFSVASNPEFLREGNAIGDFMAPDRIVIGTEDDRARDVLERTYAPLTSRGAPLLATSRRAAELVKYASNCFLATKISFINEVADLCEAVDADVEEVAAGMGLDRRIGSAFLNAGPGYGGSCFPKDCDALLATAGDNGVRLNVVSSAVAANTARKNAMAQRVVRALGNDVKGKVVTVLGLTFKADTDDVRESPALTLIEGLKQAGISVRVFDPQGMWHARRMLSGVEFCSSALDACWGADCAVIATEWREFRALNVKTLARVMRGRTIVDLRNLLDHEEFVEEGFVVHGIGRTARLPAHAAAARGGEHFPIAKQPNVDIAQRMTL